MINDENTPELEQDENENQDENQEETQETQNQPESKPKAEEKDWKAEAEKWRAEAFKLKSQNKPDSNKKNTANTEDYGFKAYLGLNGIKDSKEVDLVKQYMSETGKTAEQVIASRFFQAELKELQELAKTENATPNGKKAANTSLDSVEYWMTKPIEEVPSDMRIKVINKRLEQDKSKGVFYNS
jgi:hypothetical protein